MSEKTLAQIKKTLFVKARRHLEQKKGNQLARRHSVKQKKLAPVLLILLGLQLLELALHKIRQNLAQNLDHLVKFIPTLSKVVSLTSQESVIQ